MVYFYMLTTRFAFVYLYTMYDLHKNNNMYPYVDATYVIYYLLYTHTRTIPIQIELYSKRSHVQ